MNRILNAQGLLQSRFSGKEGYTIPDPSELAHGATAGELREYVLMMQLFMNEEVNEIILELSQGDRAINKPWASRFKALNSAIIEPNDGLKGEAIDMFCFCMNIMLACGITPENIDEHYNRVLGKNDDRIKDNY